MDSNALSFSGEMWEWRGPAPFYFVSIPQDMSDEIKAEMGRLSYGWGAIPVFCRSGEVQWQTSIFPKGGLFVVPIKNAVRFGLELEIGDEVTIHLEIAPRPHRLRRSRP